MEKKEILPSILLIEDSEEDYHTILWIMKKLSAPYHLDRVTNGEEAIQFLNKRVKYSSSIWSGLPSIIVLDLNLPGMDGRDILYELKHTEEFKTIPVIILTTTSNPKEVEACYRNRANSYILKPVNLQRFLKIFELVLEYWFDASLL